MTNEIALEPIIGLEVHAQVLTRSKMFCSCDANYSNSHPNSHVCPVCLGLPGSLPVINRKAVDHTILAALALGCSVSPLSKFDRKNYQYPDIPKGYQISQYDQPLGEYGVLEFSVDGRLNHCGIRRVHLEEDTGKSIHETAAGREVSYVDYNRSGVPLMEIVSEPHIKSPSVAKAFFETLRQVLMYLGVCDGKLEEGSMRADVNVSLHEPGGPLGTKVEIKNLNSFHIVERALEYELERQRSVLCTGGSLIQETRGWSEREHATVSQRTKEHAHDYRYFPEPDLPPLVFSPAYTERLLASMPELPAARSERLQRQYSLSEYISNVLTDERDRADFFEETVCAAGDVEPAKIANWISGDLLRLLNDSPGRHLAGMLITPSAMARLVSLVENQSVSGAAGKQVLEEMFQTGELPDTIIQRRDLSQIVDADALQPLVRTVLAENASLVEDYRGGKKKAIEALVGKAIAASSRRANPMAVRELLERELSGSGSR